MKNALLPFVLVWLFVLPVVGQVDAGAIRAKAAELWRENKPTEAAAEMGKLIAAEPQNVRYLFDQAEYLERAKDEAGVISNIDRALKLEPDKEDIVLEAVRRLIAMPNKDRCERALAVVNAFIDNHPQSDKAYHMRFFVKQYLKDDAGAFNDISRAAELNPGYPLYQSNRAILISRMGDTQLALRLLQELIETLTVNLSKTEDRNAQGEIKRALGTTWGQLAVVSERAGDKTLVIEALTQAMPYDQALYLRQRAAAYGRFGKYEEAITDLNRAIADDEVKFGKIRASHPEMGYNMTLYKDRADIFDKAGDYQKALADYRECLRRDPRNKTYYEKQIDRITQKFEKPN